MLTVPVYVTLRPMPPRPPRVLVRFRILRDGEVTAAPKYVRLYRGWHDTTFAPVVFYAPDGEFSSLLSLDLASLNAQGQWLAAGVDDPEGHAHDPG